MSGRPVESATLPALLDHPRALAELVKSSGYSAHARPDIVPLLETRAPPPISRARLS
jgi:hypothetical protein